MLAAIEGLDRVGERRAPGPRRSAVATSSRRNSGLPPERSGEQRAASWGGIGASAHRAQVRTAPLHASRSSGARRRGSCRPPSGATKPPSWARRVDAHEPGSTGQIRSSSLAQELGRRLVHPVRVLDDQQRRRREQLRQQRLDDAVQARAPEGRLQLLDLLRRLHGDVERQRDEREPRQQAGVEPLDLVAQRRARRLVGGEVEQRAQDAAEREVRRRGFVLLADCGEPDEVGRLFEELLDEPGLAEPGSPISSTMFPKPIRTGPSAAEMIISSRSRPTNGPRWSVTASPVACTAWTS